MKMARYIGVMYKLKKYLPLEARLQIYHSFVQSHLNYCSLVWGFAAKSHIAVSDVLQCKRDINTAIETLPGVDTVLWDEWGVLKHLQLTWLLL